MVLDGLFDLSDLESIFPIAADHYGLGQGTDAAPVGQDLAETANDALHLGRLNELTEDAGLEQLDDLIKLQNPGFLLHKEAAHGIGHPEVLLDFSLVSRHLECLLVPLLGLVLKLLLSRDEVECLHRDTVLRQTLVVGLLVVTVRCSVLLAENAILGRVDIVCSH